MSVIRIKQGEPFLVYGQHTEEDEITPKSLTGITLKSQIRTQAGKLVATLVFTMIDAAAGTFTLSLPDGGSTGTWLVGIMYMDIKSPAGYVSETTAIIIQPANTLI